MFQRYLDICFVSYIDIMIFYVVLQNLTYCTANKFQQLWLCD